MDLLLIGTAFLFAFLAVIVWQSVRSGPLTGTELRRRINALHHDNIGHQLAGPSAWAPRMVERCRFLMIRRGRSVRTGGFTGLGITLLALLVWVGGRYVPPSHDLEPVQVPATVVSGSLTTVDPTAAEPDPARHSFAVSTRATFWTHVTGGRPGDMVRHVWFHENRTVGAVDLAVGSPSWRTYSRRPVTEGDWVVEVWDVAGRVLARHEFRGKRSGVHARDRLGHSTRSSPVAPGNTIVLSGPHVLPSPKTGVSLTSSGTPPVTDTR